MPDQVPSAAAGLVMHTATSDGALAWLWPSEVRVWRGQLVDIRLIPSSEQHDRGQTDASGKLSVGQLIGDTKR
jgi:hypothetical protein